MPRSTARLAGGIFLLLLLVFGTAGKEAAAISPGPALARLSPEAAENQSGIAADQAGRGRATGECFQLRPGSAANKGEKARRCEPQSLPFARCRSGINTCRIGYENGPLTWFACEKERGNTSVVPRPGSILILAANSRRGMPTGHVAYVEEVVPQGATTYRLVFSHTNYDRKCSLETNIEATYDSVARTLDIHGGAWGAWGKGLQVAGFIME